jgi:hypothetical protein
MTIKTAGQRCAVKYLARACFVPYHSKYWQQRDSANQPTALDVGQLVKDEYFTLFESIGAIEVRLCDR